MMRRDDDSFVTAQPISEIESDSAQEMDLLGPSHSPVHSELSRSGSISLQDSWKAQRAEAELRKCLGKDSTDTLLKSYSCAWQKDILVQGRMYVTSNWFCFYSNILGWETKTCIKFTDVTSISKQKTALVFPNAILIEVGPKKYGFSSVVHRDKVFHVLITVWRNALSTMPLTESALLSVINDWKHSSLPRAVQSSSFNATDGSDSDHTTHSHHTLPTSTQEDSFDSDSPTPDDHTDSALIHGELSTDSSSIHTSTSSCSNSSQSSDSEPTAPVSGSTQDKHCANDGELQWFKHDLTIAGFQHNLKQLPLIKRCTSTLLINIFLILFIAALLLSTLTMLCRLSQMEPSLQPYLVLQPWCMLCRPADQLPTLKPHIH